MKHGVKLSLLALALASAGFTAQAVDQAEIIQTGNGNNANYQSQGGNSAIMTQEGDGNTIATGLFVDGGSSATITQTGNSNDINLNTGINHIGNQSTFLLTQSNDFDPTQGQEITIDLDGAINVVDATQRQGDGLNADGDAGDGNDLTIIASGDNNTYVVTQEGENNSVDINATDFQGNSVTATQEGDNNTLDMDAVSGVVAVTFDIDQGGDANRADFTGMRTVTSLDDSHFDASQQGSNNNLDLSGALELADVTVAATQLGDGNMISGDLSGLTNVSVDATQNQSGAEGNGLEFTIQSSGDSSLTTVQDGGGNTMDVDISYSDAITYTLSQSGDNNDIESASSEGALNISLDVSQTGELNSANITADGSDTDYALTQGGGGNIAVVKAEVAGGDERSQVSASQSGAENSLYLLLDASDLVASLTQQGSANKIGSNGSLDNAFQVEGQGHRLTLSQDGAGNTIEGLDGFQFEVSGEGNVMELTQAGDANIISVGQDGIGNAMAVTQNGAGNTASVAQLGIGNSATITQGGSGNIATVAQMTP